tara:strand:- start:117 stop:521 length:405 start_codon:yes stop_codon:yes gene_type:complete
MSKIKNNKLIRYLYVLLGTIFVGLAIFGIFLPGLPTTPFLIVASYFYIRSSERLYNWLINNKFLGIYLKDYLAGHGIPKKSKIFALSMMTLFVLLAIIPVSPISIPSIWIRIIVLISGIIGFLYLSFKVPTKKD